MLNEFLNEHFPSLYKRYNNLKRDIKSKYYRSLDESHYKDELAKTYEKRMGEPLDWDNLRTYNEKMQWAKLYERDPLKTLLSDKYLVRDWVKEKIGEKYLIPLLGVWDSFDEIDFDKLPKRFVLKANNSSETVLIVKDKDNLDKKNARKKVNRWLKEDYAFREGFQLQYKDIEPKIIAEKFIQDSDGKLPDYKFMCFNGKAYYCWIDVDRETEQKRNVYDLNWELQEWSQNYFKPSDYPIPKPKNFEKMIEIANELCKEFSHVRVDLYNVDGKIYFGEMTFTSGNGFAVIHPQKYNYMLGDLWKLPIDSNNGFEK